MTLKNNFSTYCLAILLSAFFIASLPGITNATPAPLQLFFSGNVLGETEPCG